MRIVCAGAGTLALEVAAHVKRHSPQTIVTLITRERRHAPQEHVPEILAGRTHIENVTVDIEQYCHTHGIECIIGEITAINRIDKTIMVGPSSLHYDYLLLNLGSEANTHGVHGAEHAHTRGGAIGMLELRQHIVTQFMKLRATNKPQHKTFIVAGAGVSGVETATALHTLVRELCEQHMIFPHEIAIILVEHDSSEYPLRPSVLKKLRRVLEEKDIEYYAGRITSFTGEEVVLDDVTLESETLIWCGRKHAHRLLRTLGLPLDEYGSVLVNSYLQTDDPAIFAGGDCARIPQAAYQTIPRTAFMALDEESAIAQNLIAASKNKPLKTYTPRKPLPVIITTGPQTACLVTQWYSWHGKIPFRLKSWVREKYARRVPIHYTEHLKQKA